jgi:hypothetical protein
MGKKRKNTNRRIWRGIYRLVVGRRWSSGPRWRPGRGSPASWRSPVSRRWRRRRRRRLLALIQPNRYTGWAGPWYWVASWATAGLLGWFGVGLLWPGKPALSFFFFCFLFLFIVFLISNLNSVLNSGLNYFLFCRSCSYSPGYPKVFSGVLAMLIYYYNIGL